MVFELVKNSLRAVQEKYMDSDDVAPPVRIIVADGLEDVTIKAGSVSIPSRYGIEIYVPFITLLFCLIILCL